MSRILYLFAVLISLNSFAQNPASSLSYKEYIFNIINEHPIAKTAQLKQKIAKAKLLSAKGGFDPSLVSSFDQKQFNNTEYYTLFKNKITIPTPLGVNITGGFDNNTGKYLNPQDKITNSGLWSAGLEIDVLQGLFTNTRRTALKQAKVYQKIAKNQQQQLLNELIYNASIAYAEWQQYASIYQIMQQNLHLSQLYLNNTKSALKSGEKTEIDTLEASLYVQSSRVDLSKYKQLLTEKRLKVENNLWLDNMPVALNDTIQPENQFIANPESEIELYNNLDSIPLISEKINKKEALLLKQRLNREKLKPKLKVKYNQLLNTTENNINPNFNIDNYKWSASLNIPLLFRSERGKYRESKYNVEKINYEIAYKKTEIENKIRANQQQQIALSSQIDLLEKNIKGYQKLLQAESTKFNYGESSLFLVNKRQEKLIESELKLLNTQNKLVQNYLDYLLLTNQIIPEE